MATISIVTANASQNEGDSGATAFTFTVTRDSGLGAASVEWAVSGSGGNPATAADFIDGVLPSGTVTFADGETSKTVTVEVAGDTAFEWSELFAVTLFDPLNVTLGTATAIGTIRNDDDGTGVWITATDAVKDEGGSGATAFTFTVLRDGITTGTARVDWSVAASGIHPADAADFFGGWLPAGTVIFGAGETSKTVTIAVNGDTTLEPDEMFTVTLSNPVNAIIGAPVAGGAAAGSAAVLTPIPDVTSDTALAMMGKVLGIDSGVTVLSAQYTGAAAAAAMFDSVNLGSAGGATLALGSGVLLTSGDGTPPGADSQESYTQDNLRPGDPALTAYAAAAFSGAGATQDASILEATFTVAAGGQPASVSIDLIFGSEEFPEFYDTNYVDIAAVEIDGVNYAYFNHNPLQPLSIIDNTLSEGNIIDNTGGILPIEYDGISAPLRVIGALDPQLTQHTIRIAIADTGDRWYDSGIFVSNLRVYTGTDADGLGLINQGSAAGVILNDDAAMLWIDADQPEQNEGQGGATAFTFAVTRSGSTAAAASADWTVTGSGAHAAVAADFVGGALPAGTVTFAAGETSKTITVNVAGDLQLEHAEAFTVTLTNPLGAPLGNAAATSVILNDELVTQVYDGGQLDGNNSAGLYHLSNGQCVVDLPGLPVGGSPDGVQMALTAGGKGYAPKQAPTGLLEYNDGSFGVFAPAGSKWTEQQFTAAGVANGKAVKLTLLQLLQKELAFGEDLTGDGLIGDSVARVFDDGGGDQFGLYETALAGACVLGVPGLTPTDPAGDALLLLAGSKLYAPKGLPTSLLEYGDGSFGVITASGGKFKEQLFDSTGHTVGKAVKLTQAELWGKENTYSEDLDNDGHLGDPAGPGLMGVAPVGLDPLA